MKNKYTDEEKEKIAMYFLTKFDFFKPSRMTRDKINNSLIKYWNNDEFWFKCVGEFKLINTKITESIYFSTINDEAPNFRSLEKAATNFWEILNNGLVKK